MAAKIAFCPVPAFTRGDTPGMPLWQTQTVPGFTACMTSASMRVRTLKTLVKAALALAIIGSSVVGVPRHAEAVAWRWPYRCFFDRGSADLKPRCRLIIEEAVASWHREREGRQYKSDSTHSKDPYAPPYAALVQVWGYVPDAGAPRAANRLSIRQAAAVAAELTRLGIPDNVVTPVGFGNEQFLPSEPPMASRSRLVNIVFY